MRRRKPRADEADLLGGTLDMLILQVLVSGAAHGFTIAGAIQRRSDDALLVEQGSLYPALHRLEERRWIASEWGTSENNRRARYYTLTPRGRKQLGAERAEFDRMVGAIQRVLGTT